jgi:hypothetical protein
MVRARQKPGVWWPGRQQRHCSTKAPTCITLSRCPPRQKHEPRARRQSKSKSKTVSPPPLSDIPILRTEPPSLQPFIPHPASGTSQSRVVIRSCHLEHLCAAVPNQTKPNHRLPSPLPSPSPMSVLDDADLHYSVDLYVYAVIWRSLPSTSPARRNMIDVCACAWGFHLPDHMTCS